MRIKLYSHMFNTRIIRVVDLKYHKINLHKPNGKRNTYDNVIDARSAAIPDGLYIIKITTSRTK